MDEFIKRLEVLILKWEHKEQTYIARIKELETKNTEGYVKLSNLEEIKEKCKRR